MQIIGEGATCGRGIDYSGNSCCPVRFLVMVITRFYCAGWPFRAVCQSLRRCGDADHWRRCYLRGGHRLQWHSCCPASFLVMVNSRFYCAGWPLERSVRFCGDAVMQIMGEDATCEGAPTTVAIVTPALRQTAPIATVEEVVVATSCCCVERLWCLGGW